MPYANPASIPHPPTDDHDCEKSAPQKRKWDESEVTAIDRRPFTIRPDSSDPFAFSRSFTPLCLLSRAQLPLASLDTVQSGSRIFTGPVRGLELLHHDELVASVLVVEDASERRLYAIERVQGRKYALCRLGEWVTCEKLLENAGQLESAAMRPAKRRQLASPRDTPGKPWWSAMAVAMKESPTPVASMGDAVPRLNLTMDTSNDPATDRITRDQPATDMASGAANESTAKPTTSAEVLEELTKQYLDALYVSRMPLAFFVKGPLARAKAAFSASSNEQLDIKDLVTFLRGTVLPTNTMDKKYREALPEVINELSPPALETPGKVPKTRRRRKWKPKRDKSGFFVEEKDCIERWWQHSSDAVSDATSSIEKVDTALKRRTPKLRNRETFLQLIMILEVLTLEKSMPQTQTNVTDVDESQHQPESQAATTVEKKSRKKKDVDFPTLLDTFADRLCIAYSLDTTSPARSKLANESESTNDDLKSFCYEVIVPFYLSHIPEHARPISKKLGGPSAPPSHRRASASIRKPGEPAIRQPPEKKPRRTLTRVSTDTLNQTKRPPSMVRSATDTTALEPLIKRERSETPLTIDRIPSARPKGATKSQPVPKKRVSMLQQFSSNVRQVDLSAMSQANEHKLRKKAEMEEKLREAITTLKKPNRALAVEELARNADQSFAKAIAKGKGSTSSNSYSQKKTADKAKPAVTATPSHVKATPAPRRQHFGPLHRNTRPNESPIVPVSSIRPPAPHLAVPSSSFAVPQTGHRPRHTTDIAETPCRGFAKYMPVGLSHPPGALHDSPTASRSAPVTSTPLPPVRPLALAETPVCRKVAAPASPLLERSVNRGSTEREDSGVFLEEGKYGAKSIYDALGWNDDGGEDLL